MTSLYAIETINQKMQTDPKQFVQTCEETYDRQVRALVRRLLNQKKTQLLMLAGPSSSGKTTTARLLQSGLAAYGRDAITISLDDFYREKLDHLTFEDGTPDYETVHSLDVEYIIHCINALLRQGKALLPRFSFQTKKREEHLVETTIAPGTVVIVEGLHALNPLILEAIETDRITKAYVSVSSRITRHGEIFLTKRDLRFVRRLVRDYQFRASSVDYTFYLWNGVRKGEDRYLFPFSNSADVRIDSMHPYEPCVFKKAAVPLLKEIAPGSAYYEEAQSLLHKLSAFAASDLSCVPKDSLLREFLG